MFLIATLRYPGGSEYNKASPGFDWGNNYICNLFDSKAINGLANPSKPWADCAMLCLGATFALFFYRSSKKIPSARAAGIVKYVGVGSMLFAVLVVTPLHNIVVTVAGTGALVCMFYITVFLFRSKLLFLKMLSIICLIVFYGCSFIYYTRIYLELLPIVQKIWLLIIFIWVLCVEFMTTAEDFQSKKKTALQKGL